MYNKLLTSHRIGLGLLVLSLILQAIVGAVFISATDFSLATQGDSDEYIDLADNVLMGNGYTTMREEPYAPHASRTPGTLLVNLPFRLFFSENDVMASIFAKLLLGIVALLTVWIASNFENVSLWFTGALLTIVPSIAYYAVNPYSTGLPYALSVTLLFVACGLVLNGKRSGWILLILAAAYTISLRPAAMFVLLVVSGVALLLGFVFWRDHVLRNRLLGLSVVVIIGFLSVYLGWSYRNLQVFGEFEYSSVSGFNLLHFNAAGMIPYLDEEAADEVRSKMDELPIYIHEYNGLDQMQMSHQQGELGIELLRKYFGTFLVSHMVGVARTFMLFDVNELGQRFGEIVTYIVALFQIVLTTTGLIGLWKIFWQSDNARRALILIMLGAGLISILSSGALGKPKFRIPLEIPLVIGSVYFFQSFVLSTWKHRKVNLKKSSTPTLSAE